MNLSVLILLNLMLFFLGSCSGEPRPLEVRGEPFVDATPRLRVGASPLAGRRVSELTFIVFREGIDRVTWKKVFDMTSRLSVLRTEIQKMQTFEKNEVDVFNQKQAEISEILIWLNDESSVYLLSWGEAENCRFTDTSPPELHCNPLYEIYGANPINGGLPHFITPWTVEAPRTEWSEQSPSLTTLLRGRSETFGDFSALFRLKAEQTDRDTYYKGDVRILNPSTFRVDGKTQPHFNWAYAELRLAEKEKPL